MSELGPEAAAEKVPPLEGIGALLESAEIARSQTSTIERGVGTITVEKLIERKIEKGGLSSPFVDRRILKRAFAAGMLALNLNISDVFADERPVEPQLTNEQVQAVEKVTGIRYPELREVYNVEYLVSPDQNSSGKYIIHFGQTHQITYGSPEDNSEVQPQIIESNQKLERVVFNVVDTNKLNCIFTEANTDEQTLSEVRDVIKKGEIDLATAMERPIQTFQDLRISYDLYLNYTKEDSNSYIYHYLGDKLSRLRQKVEDVIKADKITTKNANEKTAIEYLVPFLNAFDSGGTAKATGEQPNPDTMGLAFKALMEDKVAFLCPAENEALNDKAMEALKKEKKARQEYKAKHSEISKEKLVKHSDLSNAKIKLDELGKKGEQNLTEDERRELNAAKKLDQDYELTIQNDPRLTDLKSRLDQTRATIYQVGFIEREDDVMRIIDGYDQKDSASGRPPGNVALVFGEDHDFTRAVTQWNLQHPNNTRRGLMKISPKE